MDIPKNYDFKEEEKNIQKYWQDKKVYKFVQDEKKEIYSIDTPPPTVSGKMHIGHAFSYSHQDFIARFQRMKGKIVFFPFGTDDNGLATERLIERTHKVSSKKMDRQEFINLCQETLNDLRPKFISDWKKIGMSCDFDLCYSTIDDHSRKISQKSFIDLYKAGREYRKKAPIIFCPVCKTAIAQVEMEDSERTTTLNYIKAKLETGEYAIYATTRPELHPGCVGISIDENGDYVKVEVKSSKENSKEIWIISKDAVEKMNQEFPMKIIEEFKGKKLIGKRVEVPYAVDKVYISHDVSAKTEYGSGIVFYCSYGGLDCVEWMARHKETKPVFVMDESGTYTKGPCQGLRSPEARKKILELLEESGSLIKKEKLKHVVNVHERCGNDIEYVATTQWFVKYLDLRDEFLKAGNELNWYPQFMKIRLDHWIEGLQWDWCISRQRHFGIPFPVWYSKKTGEIILADESQLPVDPINDKPKNLPKDHTYDDIVPEKDVLDTWATSSLSPKLSIELIKDDKIKSKLYPMSLRSQAHDIITFWLFNTLVKSQLHDNVNPWKDVVISGFALDPHGKKMSKSIGNVVSPQEMTEKYGADALRYWAAGTKLGEDLPFQEKDLLTGKKTITKLWNATKFAFMHLEDYDRKNVNNIKLTVVDQWVLTKLNNLISDTTDAFEKYEYSKVRYSVDRFFWDVLCTYYLEVSKYRLYNKEEFGIENYESARYTLLRCFDTVTKLFSPIMPHISEKLYQLFLKKHNEKDSIHLSLWPKFNENEINQNSEKLGDLMIIILDEIRKFKSSNNLAMNKEISKVIIHSNEDLSEILQDIKQTVHANNVELVKGEFQVNMEL